jgi:secreted trypsin-like serine protease
MRPSIAALVAVLAVLLAGVPAVAITNGEPDGTRHPNVGTLVAEFGSPEATFPLCSGSLIADDLFLTAAHCLPENLPPEYGDITLVGVGFDPVFVFGESTLIEIAGTVGHRDFDWGDFASPDIAVVRLAEPASEFYRGIEPVALPALGALDAVMAKPGWRREQVTQVGYGTTGVTHGGGPPQQVYPDVRMVAVAWLRQGPRPQGMDDTYLFNTSHPGGPGGGGGGTCSGDSGGPIFLGGMGSNLQVGITSSGPAVGLGGVLCRTAQSAAFRLDTVVAQAFLCQFGVVTCPDEGVHAVRGSADSNGKAGGKGNDRARDRGRD